MPFVAQDDYDRLLWSCDLNFVRGEDSFVRAQWAAKPMIWQIYPQSDNAHRAKLDAFLDRYDAESPQPLGALQRRLFLAWNGFATLSDELVGEGVRCLPQARGHAENWQKNLLKQEDLCVSLLRFAKSKL